MIIDNPDRAGITKTILKSASYSRTRLYSLNKASGGAYMYKLNKLRQTAAVIGVGALLALGTGSCSEMDDKQVNPNSYECESPCNPCDPCDPLPCDPDSSAIVVIETGVDTTAVDICEDVTVSWVYNNNIPGITGMTIVEKTKDTCGLQGGKGPFLWGSVREYQIDSFQGDPDSVEANRQRYTNDIITVQISTKDSRGGNSTIVWPSDTAQLEIVIGDIINSEYGIGKLLNHGYLDFTVHAYGEDMSVRTSGTHFVPIIDPTLMDYNLRLERPRYHIQKVPSADLDSLLLAYQSGKALQ